MGGLSADIGRLFYFTGASWAAKSGFCGGLQHSAPLEASDRNKLHLVPVRAVSRCVQERLMGPTRPGSINRQFRGMGMIDNTRQTMLVTALAGATVAAFNDIFRDMAKELLRFSGTDFDKRIDVLETRALNSIGGAAFADVPEDDQRFLVEQMRRIIGAAFNDARTLRL